MKHRSELDVELAEKLHGWRIVDAEYWVDDEDMAHEEPPRSTDWPGTSKVLTAMAKLGYDYEIVLRTSPGGDKHLTVYFRTDDRSSGFGCSIAPGESRLPYVVAASAARALRWKDELTRSVQHEEDER